MCTSTSPRYPTPTCSYVMVFMYRGLGPGSVVLAALAPQRSHTGVRSPPAIVSRFRRRSSTAAVAVATVGTVSNGAHRDGF
ncbi:unnamed protein product [Merluccius merluccius]